MVDEQENESEEAATAPTEPPTEDDSALIERTAKALALRVLQAAKTPPSPLDAWTAAREYALAHEPPEAVLLAALLATMPEAWRDEAARAWARDLTDKRLTLAMVASYWRLGYSIGKQEK